MAAGGYEYDFSSALPDRIVCKICQCPSRNPYLSICCGHVFCKTCISINQVKRASSSNLASAACPMCRDEEFPTVPNKQIDREVKSLMVSCTNKQKGCAWKGEIRAVESHTSSCPLETVRCEYYNVGCKAKMCRKDLKQHNKLKVEEHLALNTLKLNNLERLVYRLVHNEMRTSEDDEYWSMQLHSLATITAASGDQVCPVIVKMPGFAAVKNNKERWFSESFFTRNKGYRMCLCVDTGDLDDDNDSSDDGSDDDDNDDSTSSSSHLSILLFLMKGPHDDGLTWPLKGGFKVTLLNQVNDAAHHSETVTFDDDTPSEATYRVMDDDRATEGFGDEEFISHEDFYATSYSSLWQYVKNDNVYFQVTFENSD